MTAICCIKTALLEKVTVLLEQVIVLLEYSIVPFLLRNKHYNFYYLHKSLQAHINGKEFDLTHAWGL